MSSNERPWVASSLRLFKQLQAEYHGDDATKLWHERVIAELEAALKENREPKLGWKDLGLPTTKWSVIYKKRRYERLEISIPRNSHKPFAFLEYETVDDLDPEVDPSFLIEKSARFRLLMSQLQEIKRQDFLKRKKEKNEQRR